MKVQDIQIRILAGFLGLYIVIFGIRALNQPDTSPSKNQLQLGEAAPEGEVQIGFIAPQPLSGRTKKEILDARVSSLSAVPQELFKPPYLATPLIFDRIQDKAAWFGSSSFYYSGPSANAGEGVSVESRVLLNPFLLLVPEFWGVSVWAEGKLQWNRSLIEQQKLNPSDFPIAPTPGAFFWDARKRQAQTDWDISSFLRKTKDFVQTPLTVTDVNFGVGAHNARDWGFRFVQWNESLSKNIATERPKDVVQNTDHFRFAGTLCGVPDGCNHRSNPIPSLDNFSVVSLPATAAFSLWKREPKSGATPPDFIFIIQLY